MSVNSAISYIDICIVIFARTLFKFTISYFILLLVYQFGEYTTL